MTCVHRLDVVRMIHCRPCAGFVQVKVFACGVHKRCTIKRASAFIQACGECPDRVSTDNIQHRR